MQESDWRDPQLHVFGMHLMGADDALLLMNAGARGCLFALPAASHGGAWRARLSSACATPGRAKRGRVRVAAYSFTWLGSESRA
jgi:hypothetical protein